MNLPIVVNLVNFCVFVVRSAEILVRLVVELYQTTVSVTALKNNEMPIGVDHGSAILYPSRRVILKNNEMPIGVDHIGNSIDTSDRTLQNNEMPIGVDHNPLTPGGLR
jgi:hypothetical protein